MNKDHHAVRAAASAAGETLREVRLGTLLSHRPLPVVIEPSAPLPILSLADAARVYAVDALARTGGVLFRGFKVASPLDFKKFAASFGWPLRSYEFGSTPRTKVAPGIYSSTEYPANQSIPLHNEQSYTRQWPGKIWFHCMKPSATGGETPIADSREVYARLPARARELFCEKELLYVRNYSNALDVPWRKVFNTDDPREVERYCEQQGIEWEWTGTDELRTRQRCQAAIRHPATGEWVWFNQAHLFHISAVEPQTRASLLNLVGSDKLPRNVYFGDGSPISDALLDEVRAVYRDTAVVFPWQAGDVLMLDNILVAHGRNPFSGDRKVIVAMA